ncbi:MAG TPA: hypothetical protein DCQ98_20755 [Planctomycetaceae bacterium]|nr:hypothetical protein [Planctomycetaceae bacterium]HRE99042.1 DUF1549 domain-containing protein [Pirellulaceae bacterium]
MTRHLPDRILRIGLEEVVGERGAPDLADRILESLHAGRRDDEADRRAAEAIAAAERMAADDSRRTGLRAKPSRFASPEPSATPADRPRESRSSKRSPRRAELFLWGSIAAAVTVLVGIAAVVAVIQATRPLDVARVPADVPSPVLPNGSNDRNDAAPSAPDETPRLAADASGATTPPMPSVPDDAAPADGSLSEESVAPAERLANDAPPSPATTRLDSDQVVAELDAAWASVWVAASIEPTPEVDDRVWSERAFRAILGRAPDAYEIERLAAEKPLDRAAWAERLTSDPKYREGFANRWSGFLVRDLLDRSATDPKLIAPDAFRRLLAERLTDGVGLDAVVVELLTAEGGLTPTRDDFRPAVGYLVALDDGRGVTATANLLEKFLGVRGRCAVCHDYTGPGALTQHEFWGTVAHLKQMSLEGNQETGLRLTDVDFVGETREIDRAAVFYETPAKSLAAAFPRFVDGVDAPESGRLADFDRRPALARAIVADPRFPIAWVDRVWNELFGYPIGDAVPPSPRDELAAAFAADGYRLDALVRWIVLSEPFARSESRDPALAADMPWAGTPARFARWYPQRTKFDSTGSALAALDRAYDSGTEAILALRAGSPTTVPTPNDPGIAADVQVEPIDWRTASGWATDAGNEALLERIVASKLTDREKIEHLFRLAVGRNPSEADRRLCERRLAAATDAKAFYQDLWFVLHRVGRSR